MTLLRFDAPALARSHAPTLQRSRATTVFLLSSFCLLMVLSLQAGTTIDWQGGAGEWHAADLWGGSLPSRATEARINGPREKPGLVTIARGDVLVSHISVAASSSNVASLVLEGPSLTITAGIDVGKY